MPEPPEGPCQGLPASRRPHTTDSDAHTSSDRTVTINLLTFLIDSLAVYRLTKLITEDKLTEELRNLIGDAFPPVTDKRTGLRRISLIAYLFSCPWCISIWAAGFVFTLRKISPQTANYLSGILAASALTGISVSKGI